MAAADIIAKNVGVQVWKISFFCCCWTQCVSCPILWMGHRRKWALKYISCDHPNDRLESWGQSIVDRSTTIEGYDSQVCHELVDISTRERANKKTKCRGGKKRPALFLPRAAHKPRSRGGRKSKKKEVTSSYLKFIPNLLFCSLFIENDGFCSGQGCHKERKLTR